MSSPFNSSQPNSSSEEKVNSFFLQAATPEDFLPPIDQWTKLGGLILLAVFIAAVSLAAILKYKVVVKASAVVRPSGELRIVQAATEGKIQSIVVKENQKIDRGQAIAYVDDSRLKTQKNQLLSNLKQAKQQLIQLDAQILALDTQIAAQTDENQQAISSARSELNRSQRDYQDKGITSRSELEEVQANLKMAEKEWQGAQKELKTIYANLQSTEAAYKAAQAKLERYQKVFDIGVLSLEQIEEAKLAAEQQRQAVRAQQATIERQKENIEQLKQAVEAARARVRRAQVAIDPSTAEVEVAQQKIVGEEAKGKNVLAQLTREREQIIQQKIEITQQLNSDNQELQQTETELQNTIIRAPLSGIIQELTLRNRFQVVRQGEQIARISPSKMPLEIKAFVASGDIGKVQVGQIVQMRVSACPYPDYGTLNGTVREISPDIISPQNELNNSSQDKKQEIMSATYSVTVEPEKTILMAGTQKCQIQSGMDGRVDIISREETILQFFLRKAKMIYS